MSQVYPKLKEQLLSWTLLSTTPADVSMQVCGVNAAYVYNASHDTIADLGANIVFAPVEFQWSTLTNGLVTGFPASVSGVTPGPTLAAIVVLLAWAGGTQLACFIDQSTDVSLPQVIASTSFAVQWDAAGIFKI